MPKPFNPKEAYAPSAIIAAGVEPAKIRSLLVDSRRAPQERARISVSGRKRTEATYEYGWGYDLNFLLGLDGGKR